MAAPVSSPGDELDMDEHGILRGPDGSDFILDENGILRPAPNGRDSGINSATPSTYYRASDFHHDFDDNVRVEIATPSSSGSHRVGDYSASDRSQDVDDWPVQHQREQQQKPLGILKRGKRRVSPPNTQLTQDIDYIGPVPNNTQEFFQETPIQSQNSQNSEKDDQSQLLESQLQNQYLNKSSSSGTQEERDELNQTLRYGDVVGVDVDVNHREASSTAAEVTLSDDDEDDVTHLDLNDLERYAELELQNGNAVLSNDSQKTPPSTLPTIYLESGEQDQYIFKDDSRDIDRSSSSLHIPDVTNENMDIMDEEMPVFTGASIPFGESCEEVIGSDALILQHLNDAMATKDDSFSTQQVDIPHSLIEFEALEVQMQIQSQLAKLKEEEDVLGDFLQSTEKPEEEKLDLTSPDLAKGDSLPFENTGDSEDLKQPARPNSQSPSRIPVSKRRSLTKTGSRKSSTDSLASNATGPKTPAKKPPSPVARGRATPQKKDKENKRPDFRRSSLQLKQPRSDASTPQSGTRRPNSTPTGHAGAYKGPRPVRAQHNVPALELGTDSMDDSDIEKVRTKLRSKLAGEQSKRKQQQDVIKQLQEDYDQLLTKFALAEVTIDQLRLGAKMNLYSDSPTPQTVGQVQQAQQAQIAQPMSIGIRGQGQAGMMGQGRMRGQLGQQGFQNEFQGSRPHSRGSLSGLTPLSFQDYDEPARFQDETFGGTRGESIKIGLLFQARSLSDQMESFQMLLDEDELNTDEQEKVIDKVKVDYDKLQGDYRQAKHDSLLMKQHNLLDQENGDSEFDSDKVIEGELFRLGLKLDDLQQTVEENMRIAKRRTPFQDLARPTQSRQMNNGYPNMHNGRTVEESSTTDMEADPLDTKWQKLQKDYNALLDLFDRMKRLPKTPERDRDITALMKKLKNLHGQSPNLLQPLPTLPDSDDDTLEGSMFGSTSSVVRATPKNTLPTSDQRPHSGERRRNSESHRRRSSRGSYPNDDDDLADNDDSSRVSQRGNKGPRSASLSRSDSKREQSDKESTHSRGRRAGKKDEVGKPDNKSIRPVELDRDSGFIGSESSRHSQTNVSKRAQNMSTLTDEDESAQFPYKPTNAIPNHLSSAPPPNAWSDSELSVSENKPSRAHRTQKRSTNSVVSETPAGRARKSSRSTDLTYGRRGRPRDESENELVSTGRASVKSEKIKSLENEVEKLRELVTQQNQLQQQQLQQRQQQPPARDTYSEQEMHGEHVVPDHGEHEHELWKRSSYPWVEEQRRYARAEGKGDGPPGREYRGQTWDDFPYHGRRRSLAESDIPSIDTMDVSQSKARIRPATPERMAYERRLADKNRYNERQRSPPRIEKPRDLDRQGERREEELRSRDRGTANQKLRSRSVPRRLDYDSYDSPGRVTEKRQDHRDLDRDLDRDREVPYRGRQRGRYRSTDNLSDDQNRYRPRADERSSSPELAPRTHNEHEKHYRFLRDLEKGRQHIQKVLDVAADNRRKEDERKRREKRRQPVVVQGQGTLTKTVTECCPMCKGKGECTHTEVYHLPQQPGHLGMQFAGMSQVPIQNGDIGASMEQNVARGMQPVPGVHPPGGIVPGGYGTPQQYAQPQQQYSPQQQYTVPQQQYTLPQQQYTAPQQYATPQMYAAPQPVPQHQHYPSPIGHQQQQPMTSTPYMNGDARQNDIDSQVEGPVIKIPLRLYENRLKTKYLVKEFSDDATSMRNGETQARSRKSKPRSSSVPPRDSARSKASRYTDDNDDYTSREPTQFNTSLDEAVRLALDLKRLSGKMKSDVKDDMKRSVRSEHIWKTTDGTAPTS